MSLPRVVNRHRAAVSVAALLTECRTMGAADGLGAPQRDELPEIGRRQCGSRVGLMT